MRGGDLQPVAAQHGITGGDVTDRADLAYIRAGNRYQWVGLPGQYDNEGKVIAVHSMTASCHINASIERPGDEDFGHHLLTIRAADLVAAITAGWLVKLP